MPPLVIAAAIAAGGAVAGSEIAAHQAGNAAKLETQAAGHAADVQGQAAANALTFQQQQAAQDLATANSTQRANYDQWAAREGRLSNLSALTGAGSFTIPDYVPITNVNAVTANGLPPGTRPTPPTLRPPSPQTPLSGSYQTTMANAMMPQLQAPRNAAMGASGDPNRLVMMRAPTGQTKLVPETLVPHYTQQGAEVIG